MLTDVVNSAVADFAHEGTLGISVFYCLLAVDWWCETFDLIIYSPTGTLWIRFVLYLMPTDGVRLELHKFIS